MKKYQAKFLPVEGDIEIGDYYMWRGFPTKDEWTITRFTGANPFPVEADKDHKKVKLFICSKDIRIGDKFNSANGTGFIAIRVESDKIYSKGGLYSDVEEVAHDKTYCHKVIGVKSDDADWVKNGDEFDKGEIAYRWSEEDQPDTFVYIHEWVDFLKEKGYEKIPDYLKCSEVSIQCPHCKTFV